MSRVEKPVRQSLHGRSKYCRPMTRDRGWLAGFLPETSVIRQAIYGTGFASWTGQVSVANLPSITKPSLFPEEHL